jgi:tRNA modification GTPase
MIGLPNVGKSSLFNRLLARDRAIVTARAGTTRDTLEEDLNLDGIPVRLIDTAGLREVSDEAESEGVRRAQRAREEADLVLLVLDGSREIEPLEIDALERSTGEADRQRTVVAVNKCDLPGARERAVTHPAPLRVSALSGEGLDGLRAALRERLVGTGPLEDPIITNQRHAAALERTRSALERAGRAADEGLSEELLLEDLREAMRRLGAITGEFTNEALYDRIFSTFCVGK